MQQTPAGSPPQARGEDPTHDPRESAWLEPGFRAVTPCQTVDHALRTVNQNQVQQSAMADAKATALNPDKATLSEPLAGQMQGARSQEWRFPFQERATPQMARQRVAHREPATGAGPALQRLTRAAAIACALRLVPAPVAGSE